MTSLGIGGFETLVILLAILACLVVLAILCVLLYLVVRAAVTSGIRRARADAQTRTPEA